MAKITFETPCEIGDLFFYILKQYHYENGKQVYDYSIQPVRVEFFSFHYHKKEKEIFITADYINHGIKECFKPTITIGVNAFRNFEDAEKELLRLKEQNNETK